MQISLKLFSNGFQIAVSAHKPAELKAMFLLAPQNFILNQYFKLIPRIRDK